MKINFTRLTTCFIPALVILISAYVGWLVAGFWGWMVGWIAPSVVVGIIWWLFGQEE